jgi:hypothetical protein
LCRGKKKNRGDLVVYSHVSIAVGFLFCFFVCNRFSIPVARNSVRDSGSHAIKSSFLFMGVSCCTEASPRSNDDELFSNDHTLVDARGAVTQGSSPLRATQVLLASASPRTPPLQGTSVLQPGRSRDTVLQGRRITGQSSSSQSQLESCSKVNHRVPSSTQHVRRVDDCTDPLVKPDEVHRSRLVDAPSPLLGARRDGGVPARGMEAKASLLEGTASSTPASIGLSNALKAKLLRIELQVGESATLAMQPITPGRRVVEESENNASANVEDLSSCSTAMSPQGLHCGNPLAPASSGNTAGPRLRTREERDDSTTATVSMHLGTTPTISMPIWDTGGFYEEEAEAASPGDVSPCDRGAASHSPATRGSQRRKPAGKLIPSHQGNSSSTSVNLGSSTLSGNGGSVKTPRAMRTSGSAGNSMRSIPASHGRPFHGSFASVLSPLDAPNPSVLTAFPLGSASHMSRFSVPEADHTYSSARGERSVDAQYTNAMAGGASASSRLTMSCDFGDVMQEEDVDSRDSDFEDCE